MKNWKRDRNYRKLNNPNGYVTHIINVDGVDVEVSKEIYTLYAQYGRKMEYMESDLKRNRVRKDTDGNAAKDANGLPIVLLEREISLEKLADEGWDFASTIPTPEQSYFVTGGSDKAELSRCLTLLTDDEQLLITALFYSGIAEKEYAEMLGIKRQSLNERKRRILKKLKKYWRQPC